MLRQVAQADDRVLVIDQENAGVWCARKCSIDAAEGETVFFVDADDYIDAQTVERVLHAMESADAGHLFGGVCEPADAAPKRVQQLMSPKAGIFGARDPQLLFHSKCAALCLPHGFFARELLNREGIRFAPGLALGEDVVFQFAAYALARKTVVMPDKFYHYVMESESATHEFNSAEARAKKLDAHMRMLEEVLEGWAAYGLLGLCPGELITWFLDLIVFDLARFNADDFHRVAARVNMDLTTFLGTEWADMPAKGAVRRVAHKLVAATSGVSDGRCRAVLSFNSRSQSLPGAFYLIPSAAARRNSAAKITLLHAIQQEVLLQNSDTPKVSLLVPICNVERYLRECFDSAVAQTLKDIEIICINDGSTDSSPDIIREYIGSATPV